MTNADLSQQARTYFLQQGQGIHKLYDILGSNILLHHLRNWFSVLLEIVLYLLFGTMVLVTILMPSKLSYSFPISDLGELDLELYNENFQYLIVTIQFGLVFVSLPVLCFAILLGRNRKKNNLIRKAFNEIKQMKEYFDTAVKELNF